MTEKKLKIVFWPNDSVAKKIAPDFALKVQKIVKFAVNDPYPHKLNVSIEADNPQTLGEEEYDARIEYPIRVNNIQSCEHLIHLLNFFHLFLDSNIRALKSTFSASIVLVTKEFFGSDFCSANMNLTIHNFSFVNLVEHSVPLIHYPIAIRDDRRHRDIMKRFYGREQQALIMADFEHDRRQLIVRFPHSERRVRSMDGQTEDVDFCATLTIRYKTIRRILVNIKSGHKVEGCLGKFALELYFHLSSPPVIRRIKLYPPQGDKKPPANLLTKYGDRYTVWDLRQRNLNEEVNDSPIFRLLIYNVSVEEYCSLLDRLSVVTERQLELRIFFDDKPFRYRSYVRSPVEEEGCVQMCQRNYKLMYMIAALLSRGAIVKDYIMASTHSRDEFVRQVAADFEEDSTITLEVMEKLLSEIDERLDGQPPLRIYKRIFDQVSRNAETVRQLHAMHSKEGYVRVRKVVVTPTRILFVAPELLMGNRVLRMDPERYPLERFLRVVFRDDDGQPVHGVSVGEMLIDRFILRKLMEGINIAGHTFCYFGSSNSQLRDNGCYFIDATVEEILEFRQRLGTFKVQSAPKMMSRLGQCFTQARETGIELERKDYAQDMDFEGGKDSNDKPYNFSDGVGKISLRTAEQLSQELKLEGCVPSCFQIRYRGFKGVLSVDKSLDERREWGRRNGVNDLTDSNKRDCWLDLKIQFRPSQRKFLTMRENQKLEIVKYSSPVMLSLNRPVINILDQVSAMQSHSSHQRICSRIHLLMDIHLYSLTKSLMDETRARNKLGEFPKLILYDQVTDLNLTKEPFFRSMVRASVRASLKKLRQKLQIPIPFSLGRAMFGVVDESGQLQYGQVFIKYTKNAGLKLPGEIADRQILKGPVMITKNPSIVAGDIRMFEAVDILALNHLCDVVVFPRYGPRPHTDEMAGSDLDGDEYTIIWDEQLYLDYNEEAFDYTSKAEEAIPTTEEQLRTEMAQFFVNYIKQDSIGRIANAFLINSDLFGIKSDVCMAIANKHMEAVDFPKTGKPPKPLTTKWSDQEPKDIGLDADEEQPEEPTAAKPPERPERTPDFMEKNNEPTYISSRLNGQLYRRAKEIDDILSIASLEEELNAVTVDQLISVDGCDSQDILSLANAHYEAYAANIQSIMDSYGIKTEGELFSGHFTSLRNRLSDKDSDDMSFYNTTNAIEHRLFAVFSKFRKQFFETSLTGPTNRYEDVTTPLFRNAKINGVKDVFRRICQNPSEDYQRLACAYYKISYDSVQRRLLSFPWLAWDVINHVRRSKAISSSEAKFSFDPLSEKLSQHIKEFVDRRKKYKGKDRIPYVDFRDMLKNPQNAQPNEQRGWRSVARYCKRYTGLDDLMFFCIKWAEKNGILDDAVNELHICVLLLQFGLNHLPCESVETVQYWLELIEPNQPIKDTINLGMQYGGLGKKFMLFMGFLASRQFETLPLIDFSEPGIGYSSRFYQGQWLAMHKAALKTFHQIAFTFRFDELLPSTSKQMNVQNIAPQEHEADPFVIEVPSSHQGQVINNQELLNRLCCRTGCTNIVFRPLPQFLNGNTVRILVSSTGDMKALSNLRSLLAVRPNLNLTTNCRQMSILMAAAVYEKLISEK